MSQSTLLIYRITVATIEAKATTIISKNVPLSLEVILDRALPVSSTTSLSMLTIMNYKSELNYFSSPHESLVSTAFNISHASYHIVLPVHNANHIKILAHTVRSNQKSTEKAATIHSANANPMLIVATYFFLTNPS